MRSFRLRVAVRFALTMLAILLAVGAAAVVSLRVILARQLDGTLLQLADVEAKAGASATSPSFRFHEGVFLAGSSLKTSELTRYAELWSSEGQSVARSANLGDRHLPLPPQAMEEAKHGSVGVATHRWDGAPYRTLVYPLRLVAAVHAEHFLQVAAPLEPLRATVWRFGLFTALLGLGGTAAAFAGAWMFAGLATRPAQEIAAQAEAIEAGTLSARITAHAEVTEYRRLVAVLNAMLDRLERAFQAQRRFVADASHELRSPLTVLKGDIDVALRRERTPEEYRAALESGREEVDRMTALAENLLTLARADAGLPRDQMRPLDLAVIAARVVERTRRAAEQARVAVALDASPTPSQGDAALLERAVGNLVENAIRYAPSGASVALRCAVDDTAVFVEVEDGGPGVDPQQAVHIFERFYRGDPARSRGAGAGLGLPIARAIVEAHGGRLELARAQPGALFRITLPAVRETPGSSPRAGANRT
jgi:two-component system OmpR family sensor kinase